MSTEVITQSRAIIIANNRELNSLSNLIATQVEILKIYRPEDIQPEVEDTAYQSEYTTMLQNIDSALEKGSTDYKGLNCVKFILSQCDEIRNRKATITTNDTWIGIWKGEEPRPNETFHGLLDRYIK